MFWFYYFEMEGNPTIKDSVVGELFLINLSYKGKFGLITCIFFSHKSPGMLGEKWKIFQYHWTLITNHKLILSFCHEIQFAYLFSCVTLTVCCNPSHAECRESLYLGLLDFILSVYFLSLFTLTSRFNIDQFTAYFSSKF